MAKFFTDFSEYPAGEAPDDWEIATPTTMSVEVGEKQSLSKNVLYFSSATPIQNIQAVWSKIPASKKVEIYAEMQVIAGNVNHFIGPSVSVDKTHQQYWLAATKNISNGLRMFATSTGTGSPIQTYPDGNLNELSAFLLQYDDNEGSPVVRGKLWTLTQPEPDEWQIYTSISSWEGALFSGLTSRSNNCDKCRFANAFGAGTDGDPAPREPIKPPTPIGNNRRYGIFPVDGGIWRRRTYG